MAVINLAEGEEEVINVSVGFRPTRVIFSADSTEDYVITEDGVSILELADVTEGYVAPTVAVSQNPFVEGIQSIPAPDSTVVMDYFRQ